MGTAALSNRVEGVAVNGRRTVDCTVTLSSSYATGGDTIPLDTLGLKEVFAAHVVAIGGTDQGYSVQPVTTTPSAPKVKLTRRADANTVAEPAAATNVSAVVATIRFFGV